MVAPGMYERSMVSASIEKFRRAISPTYSGVIIDPASKTAFLPIPKNANSFTKAAFLMSNPAHSDFNPKKETAIKYLRRNKTPGMHLRKWKHLSQYTTVAIIRDPAERLTSCFANKMVCRKSSRQEREKLLCQIQRKLNKKLDYKDLTFLEFLTFISLIKDERRDRHYRTQHYFIGGIKIDRAIRLDRNTDLDSELGKIGLTIPPRESVAGIHKKTPYNGRTEKDLSNARIGWCQKEKIVPDKHNLFNDRVAKIFCHIYRKDIALYCKLSNISEEEYLNRLLHERQALMQ